MRKTHYLIIIAVIVVLLIAIFWPRTAAKSFTLGECLTEKGVTMFGSDVCEQCKNQKKILGAEFAKIKYINCEFNYDECRKKKITVYPLWSLQNKILIGVQSTDALAAFAGCKN